jgi:transposase-like protein
VWLYLRFTLSYRDVKELRAERGLDVSYESAASEHTIVIADGTPPLP